MWGLRRRAQCRRAWNGVWERAGGGARAVGGAVFVEQREVVSQVRRDAVRPEAAADDGDEPAPGAELHHPPPAQRGGPALLKVLAQDD